MGQRSELATPKGRLTEIISEASDLVMLPQMSIKKYARSALQLFYLAGVFELDKEVGRAFRHYTRFIVLLVEHLPKHPDYAKFIAEQPNEYRKLMSSLNVAFESAERLKEILLSLFEVDYTKQLKKLKEESERRDAEEKTETPQPPETDDYLSNDVVLNEVEDCFVSGESLIKATAATASNQTFVVPDRRLKPVYKEPSRALTGLKYNLRQVLIPRALVDQFMAVANSNTSRNVETCGVLAGKWLHGQFVVTVVIVPKQSGTSNTCSTRNEEDIFAAQDKFDVITLGWIHTHPSQTAFLSSVDMHTHCSYQLMLPESVAIVCAPTYKQTGVFMLTPYGLKVVSRCKRDGFHPHGQEDHLLFETCQHTSLTDSRHGVLLDLRQPISTWTLNRS